MPAAVEASESHLRRELPDRTLVVFSTVSGCAIEIALGIQRQRTRVRKFHILAERGWGVEVPVVVVVVDQLKVVSIPVGATIGARTPIAAGAGRGKLPEIAVAIKIPGRVNCQIADGSLPILLTLNRNL